MSRFVRLFIEPSENSKFWLYVKPTLQGKAGNNNGNMATAQNAIESAEEPPGKFYEDNLSGM